VLIDGAVSSGGRAKKARKAAPLCCKEGTSRLQQSGNIMEKKLILVSAPPASGKTYVSMELAKNLKHVVYLDKDTLVPLSNVVFNVANEPNDRNGPFFEKYLRDVEYQVILNLALDALKYDNIVLINAPFTKEIHDSAYLAALRKELKEDYGAHLAIIWVVCDVEIVHQRMMERNSPRDTFKLADWDAYVKTQHFEIPTQLKIEGDPYSLILFHNNNDQEFASSMKEATALLEERKQKEK
jgi:tRNA uridine 5-carbamoylmethylation protein Kti12